jgi:ribosomal protein S3
MTKELTMDQLDRVSGGDITVVVDKGYAGLEIKVGGYGVAVWVTQGEVHGKVTTPK